MSEKFEREERYIVFKVKDLSEHKLGWVRDVIRLNDIPTVEAVVVEADWPEYEPTWAAIERRVTGGGQWNGGGIPPVGTVCEFNSNWAHTVGIETWHKVTVVFASDEIYIVRRDTAPEGEIKEISGPVAIAEFARFRPYRTPEQIAEDQRKAKISDLADEISSYQDHQDPSEKHFRLATYLIDQGYGKQVTP